MAKSLTINKDVMAFFFFSSFNTICCALHRNTNYLYTFFLLFDTPGNLTGLESLLLYGLAVKLCQSKLKRIDIVKAAVHSSGYHHFWSVFSYRNDFPLCPQCSISGFCLEGESVCPMTRGHFLDAWQILQGYKLLALPESCSGVEFWKSSVSPSLLMPRYSHAAPLACTGTMPSPSAMPIQPPQFPFGTIKYKMFPSVKPKQVGSSTWPG